MLKRKLISALYLSFFTVLIFTLWDVVGILKGHQSFSAEFPTVTGKTFLLLIPDAWMVTVFAYPVIFVFGVTLSVLADWVTRKMKKGGIWTSLLLHFLFGVVGAFFTLGYGLLAAFIGFGIDRYLSHKNLKKASWGGIALTVLVALNGIGVLLVQKYSGLEY